MHGVIGKQHCEDLRITPMHISYWCSYFVLIYYNRIIIQVSNGAECIMFSKKFFMQHADELVKKMIRHQVRHYPTEYTLQQNLQSKVDWDLYKRRLIRDTMLINNYTKPNFMSVVLW